MNDGDKKQNDPKHSIGRRPLICELTVEPDKTRAQYICIVCHSSIRMALSRDYDTLSTQHCIAIQNDGNDNFTIISLDMKHVEWVAQNTKADNSVIRKQRCQ